MTEFWTGPVETMCRRQILLISSKDVTCFSNTCSRKHQGTGENASHQHFSLFPSMFSKAFSSRFVGTKDCAVQSSIV